MTVNNTNTHTRHPKAARGFTMVELLMVIAITGVIAAVAVPMIQNVLGGFRLSGDARGLANAVSLAKLQSSANFTRSRVYVDLAANTYHIELWQKAPAGWVAQGGTRSLAASNEQYGFGPVGTPPPNSQAAIAMAPNCQTAAGLAIGNTACVVFNSRGVPIDGTGAPTGADALYVTDNNSVFGITVSAAAMIHLWRTARSANPTWVLQ